MKFAIGEIAILLPTFEGCSDLYEKYNWQECTILSFVNTSPRFGSRYWVRVADGNQFRATDAVLMKRKPPPNWNSIATPKEREVTT